MGLIGLSHAAGVTSSSIQELAAGSVPVGIAMRLGVVSSSLQEFVDGGTSIGLAQKIGCLSSNLQELRDLIGQGGAIGFILGVCVNIRK